MRRAARRWRPGRRGVTLIEMMVTVALVLLIMTIIISVFRQATGTLRAAQVGTDLDQALRRLDATIRQDLTGATARFTPPLDPKNYLGYFEYGENTVADTQGEDSDDWMSFTVKAPEGQPFTGRFWVNNSTINKAIQPITITSEFAEVIYFLRNGNLYRRVLLIVPERQSSVASTFPLQASSMFGSSVSVSWQGVNDVSARPTNTNSTGTTPPPPPTLNTLSDLTNRENRAFRPRFCPDYANNSTGAANSPDGLPDDTNNDGVPDYYPTLYFNPGNPAATQVSGGLLNESPAATRTNASLDTLPFPFVFPGAYSQSDVSLGVTGASAGSGLIHGLNPLNHNPLELYQTDNLSSLGPVQAQTYWGWPTWKETLSVAWTDPSKALNTSAGAQNNGMSWISTSKVLLPKMTTDLIPSSTVPYRLTAQPFNDGAGVPNFTTTVGVWKDAWEDDLIMTGVRSFDIKAYDPFAVAAGASSPGYFDLGYGYTLTSGASNTGTPVAWLPTFAHEGRMPPLSADNRNDPQAAGFGIIRNVGDNTTVPVRLRRVWDSWSTEYTNAPALPLNPANGPLNGLPPVYPSYPPPYPAPLRGIEIQIRVVNMPDADRVKVLTIRQDFTDKL